MKLRGLLFLLLLPALLVAPISPLLSNTSAVDIFDKTCTHGSVGTVGNEVCTDVKTQQNNQTKNPVISIIKAATILISYVIGVAAIIGIIISAIRMIISGGDSNNMASARKGLYYCVIGLAVAVLAQTMVVFILARLT